MSRDHPGPDRDRLLAVRLDAIATRHARWGAMDEDQLGAGAAELREVADGRGDLLAETAGLALGTNATKGPSYVAGGGPSRNYAA